MTVCRIVVSTLYVFAGVSGFLAFMMLKNYPTAILAVCTGIINGLLTHIHFLNYKNKLHEWYSSSHLRQIGRVGFYFFAFGAMSLAYFSAVEIMLKTPILPVSSSIVLAIIWSIITLKSGLVLYYFARSYNLDNDEQLLIEDNRETPSREESGRSEFLEP